MARSSAQPQATEASSILGEWRLRAPAADAVSDQVAEYKRYQLLVRRAVSVFGDEITASRWLSTASVDFGGEAPLSIARRNGYALKQLEPIFVRIEHGIYF